MNKYNVRAVRKELDGFILHSAWKKFRLKFLSLSDDLRKAVVELRPNKKHKSLLHILCRSVHAHPPVPMDVLESVILASPNLLQLCPTPLSVALDRNASKRVIECLLLHEHENSLYARDGKGDTPLLQAVRQDEPNEDVWKLLVRLDSSTKESLLLPSKKRNKIPLFYVAHNELDYVNFEDEIPEELEYLLLQTYLAFEIQQGRVAVSNDSCDTISQDGEIDSSYYHEADSYYDFSDEEHSETHQESNYHALLYATIACASFMGDKATTKLLRLLLSRIDALDFVDDKGNTLLHHVCRSSHSFADISFVNVPFLDYLISQHPQGLTMENTDGHLPLHLAIHSQKDWTFLRSVAVPEAARLGKRLALHLALLNHPSVAKQLFQLYPEAASMIDMTMRLFPFQLAACSHLYARAVTSAPNSQANPDPKGVAPQNIEPNEKQAAELNQLCTVFFLLRASPQVLQEFL